MLETPDLKDFSISSWYKTFEDICLRTIIINIPEELVARLQLEECGGDIEEICKEEDVATLKNALNSLNGEAFVKNNWHAPVDAKAFSFGNTLKVTNLDNLMLYLTASDILLKDFGSNKGVQFCIALKPWKSIHPASEFRCIVINNVLRGITSRDWPAYYAHFNEEGSQIVNTLNVFYKEHIKNKFPRNHYTFDVVLSYPDSPYVLDFGPINCKTNLYAFSWKEIQPLLDKQSSDEVPPVFRFLESDIGIMTRADAIHKFVKSQNQI